MARRGSCQNIYCDNGRNLVGASNKLQELQDAVFGDDARDQILNHCNQRRIQFHFIPPRTPHMGGLWEASVKSLKRLLHRTLLSAALRYEELCTVATEIEAVLNSRPMTQLSTDPNDLNALTPGHFLIGESMTATVDPHATTHSMKLLARWELVSFCRAEFWKRWSLEYISNLQTRAKWLKEYPDMKIGTFVLIKEDNISPLQWTMGRVVDLSYGPDGHARVAYVRTPTGTIKRAIHNLAPLPIEIDSDKSSEEIPTEPTEQKSVSQVDGQGETRRKRKQQKDPSSNKTKSRSYIASTITIIMMTLLLLPIAMANNHVNIQPLTTNSGLFYDKMGQIQLSPTSWTVMAYFNLSAYQALSNGIITILDRMKTTSKSIKQRGPYSEIISHFEKRIYQLHEVNKMLTGIPAERFRRAAINIGGTILNRLFGVLDEEYADEMKSTIDNVYANEQQLQDLLQRHTSVLDSTLNIIKRDHEEIMAHTMQIQCSFKEDIEQLSRTVNAELIQHRASDHFNLLASLITSYFQEYEQIQDNIADVSLGLHQGHVSIHVISPSQLQTQLKLIKQQLPSGLKIPTISRDNLQNVYKMMTIQGRLLNDFYLFKIDIPLVHDNDFKLYNLVPVPVMRNNTQMFIKPTTDYIAINMVSNQYYALNAKELNSCWLPSEEVHVCHQERPIEEEYSKLHQCESELVLAKSIPPSCVVWVSYAQDSWVQLTKAGTWLYALSSPSTATVVCKNGIFERVALNNAGILSLDQGCTLRTKNITLTSFEPLVTTIKVMEQPQVNLSATVFDIGFSTNQSMNITKITSGLLFHQNIGNIETRIDQLKNQQINLTKLQPHDVHQYSVSYLSLLLIILIIGWMIYNKYKCTRNKPPQAIRFVLRSNASERPEDVE